MKERFTWAKANSKEEIDSFEELFRLYYPHLIRYTGFFIKKPEEAGDLVQDVFFQLWKNKSKINQEKSISAFIFTQLKNKCLTSVKRKIVEEKYKDFQGIIESQKLYHLSMDSDTDFEAMEWAIQKGRSVKSQKYNIGAGLDTIVNILKGTGNLEIYSGNALLKSHPSGYLRYVKNPIKNFIGTLIEITIDITKLESVDETILDDYTF